MWFKHVSVTHAKKSLLAFIAVRNSSDSWTPVSQVEPEIVNKNITLRRSEGSEFAATDRPLVLIYSWLVAKAKHIYKYGDYYLGKGFDVVEVKVTPEQLMRPVKAQAVVESLLDFLSTNSPQRSQPLLLHGFSVGGYLYGETLVKILDNEKQYGSVGQRLKGQMFDSPIDLNGVPQGVSQTVTTTPLLQKMVFYSLHGYLQLFDKSVTRHYRRSAVEAKTNRLGVPTLFLYSHSDHLACANLIEEVIASYRRSGINTHVSLFPNSAHVAHYRNYPTQYIAALDNFLQDINLGEVLLQQGGKE